MTSPMDITESNNVDSKAGAPKPIITSTTNSKNSHDSETEEGTNTTIATVTSPKDNRKTTNMEISTITASPTASPIDTPFVPPKGPCDVGDIVSYNKKWMTLKSDGQWHETEGPDDFEINFCGFKDADFFRYEDHCHGYRKQLEVFKSYTGYHRLEENLDIEFEKYKIQHGNEKILRKLQRR
ncbi:uncharacterized protein EAF02_009958 [Botrytis sinoallii]|uniref:uncharacterized protein n=1 Tax=Botrytis sinoallii TaxID=1463999 RepID=UPI001901F6CC|nr:uncharacterized protein EAF02_009958 [Botrytis sinoallii]KAF7865535.1 hypothetical protein EAF02_009958 [Botrytis sinoallii]